jgi:uncharacterized protein YoaH (UPF0181 family)
MCPVCIATTALLITSAVSSGGATAVVVNKLRTKEIAKNIFVKRQKEESWGKQHTSK